MAPSSSSERFLLLPTPPSSSPSSSPSKKPANGSSSVHPRPNAFATLFATALSTSFFAVAMTPSSIIKCLTMSLSVALPLMASRSCSTVGFTPGGKYTGFRGSSLYLSHISSLALFPALSLFVSSSMSSLPKRSASIFLMMLYLSAYTSSFSIFFPAALAFALSAALSNFFAFTRSMSTQRSAYFGRFVSGSLAILSTTTSISSPGETTNESLVSRYAGGAYLEDMNEKKPFGSIT
mmetsp:Transcript_19966/g.40134  ORF Transcript_19966/g.40134 Transcript_19966/m.40134 type:complete len:236 (-) Transcript_19966:1547-2254(-)